MTEWESAEWVREEERELRSQNASENKKIGRYVEIYSQDKKGVYCKIGCEGLGHPLGMFDIQHKHWTGLEKTFMAAGYEVRRKPKAA